MNRRRFLKYVGAGAIAVGGAASTYYLLGRHKNSAAGKLEQLRGLEKKWIRQQRLAETPLKNIRRSINRYERKQQAVSTASPTEQPGAPEHQ